LWWLIFSTLWFGLFPCDCLAQAQTERGTKTGTVTSKEWINGFNVGFSEAVERQKFALIFWHIGGAGDRTLRTQLNKLALAPSFSDTIFVDVDFSKEEWRDYLADSPDAKPLGKPLVPVVSILLPGKMNAQQAVSRGAAHSYATHYREIARSEGLASADQLARRLLPGMCAELLDQDSANLFRVTDSHLKSECSRR
jgi:hypothetical protein